MLTRLTLLLCLLTLAVPALAVAQSPFGPLPPGQSAPDTTSVDTTANVSSDDGDGGLASWQTTLILGAGFVLLLSIAVAIVRDARSRAPAAEPTEQIGGKTHNEAETQRRKQQARAREKRAREARKKNRPRRS
jgi:hypothetical protein